VNKILILGSGSFAGSALIDYLLNKKFKIIGVNRSIKKKEYFLPYKGNLNIKNLLIHKININNNLDLKKLLKIIKKNRFDYIIDFLGQGMVSQSWDHPDHWIETNILNKIKIIDYIVKEKIKIKKYVRISTPEVYGDNKKKILENFSFNPSTPYALTHATIDSFLKLYYKQYKFPYVIGRFSNFYGEHQQLYRVIPKTILSIIRKKKFNLEGNGRSKRNFLFQKDFCEGIFCLIKKGEVNNTYHFSGKNLIMIKDLIKKICKIMDYDFKKLIRYTKERRSLDKTYKLNTNKARVKLGWKSKISLNDGLYQTIKYIEKNYLQIKSDSDFYIHKK
tara:strand:- start:138 stop:1136 length:999 start_codon:yes stop_codon:yes gene_type:complete